MGKGPGLYSDIGRRVRDLLNKDYNSDMKCTLITYSPTGSSVYASGTKKDDYFLAEFEAQVDQCNIADCIALSTIPLRNERDEIPVSSETGRGLLGDFGIQLKHKNVTTDMKVDYNSNTDKKVNPSTNLYTTVTVDEPTPGLKAILGVKVPYERSGKLELQYLHNYAGICASVGLTCNPTVNFSGVLGNDKLVLGSDVSFDTKLGVFTKCNFGTSFTNSNKIAALTLNDKGDTFSALYYHTVSPSTHTAVGAEVTHSFSSNENTITVGTQHALHPLTMVKTRLNNFGKANAVIRHEFIPRSFISLSTEMDIKCIYQSAKIGIAMDLRR